MKAFITGGMGFVGSHLAEALAARGARVSLFDRDCSPRFDFDPAPFLCVEGDVRDCQNLLGAMEGHEVVFHLAGLLGTDYLVSRPAVALEVNVSGTLKVLEAAREVGAAVVYLSLLPRWNNPYMITKNCAEEFCRFYHLEHGVPCVTLKAAHIYGPRQGWSPVQKAVPTFIRAALAGTPLPVFGSGTQLMDLLYVTDAVEALIRAAGSPELQGRSLELGSGTGTTVLELATRIIALCGSRSRIVHQPMRPGEPLDPGAFQVADTEAQRRYLGLQELTSLEDGLERTIRWYREYGRGGG